jgi:hypothetical protein
MTIPLKPITRDGIPAALQKAERYRLLNEPGASQSICLDVLAVDPEHQQALKTLLLSITDQFVGGERTEEQTQRALEVVPRLRDEYARHYYTGVIRERQAVALLRRGVHDAGPRAYDAIRRAMRHFEDAEAMRAAGNDEAILRWNTCARLLDANPQLAPRESADEWEPAIGE